MLYYILLYYIIFVIMYHMIYSIQLTLNLKQPSPKKQVFCFVKSAVQVAILACLATCFDLILEELPPSSDMISHDFTKAFLVAMCSFKIYG